MHDIAENSIIAVNSQNGSLGTLYNIVVFDDDMNKIEKISTWKFNLHDDGFTPLASIKKSAGRFVEIKLR